MVSILGQRITKRLIVLYATIIVLVSILFKLSKLLFFNQIQEDFHPHLDLNDVKRLLSISGSAGIVVILFDPLILLAWKKNPFIRAEGMCLFLCHTVGPLTFGVTDSQLSDKPYFLAQLAQSGFTVTRFYGPDNLLSHIFLVHSGSPLHIVILHWQNSGYWRQYALNGAPHLMNVAKQFITVEAWNIMNVDRAYERFNTNIQVIDGIKMTVPTDVEKFVIDHKGAHFIPCNQTLANYYYLKYKQKSTPDILRFKHQAWKLLAKSKTLLDKLKIPFWLSSGTCLGFFRQCDIIPWGMDVDLGIFIDDYQDELVAEFEKKGLKLLHRLGKLEDSYELSFIENDIKLDLFFFYTEGATVWNGGTQVKTGKKFKYVFPSFTLCWTEFLELKVRIPCQTKDYIEANYGHNWFQPVKSWDWKSSPPNVIENGMWAVEELSKVIVLNNS